MPWLTSTFGCLKDQVFHLCLPVGSISENKQVVDTISFSLAANEPLTLIKSSHENSTSKKAARIQIFSFSADVIRLNQLVFKDNFN